jgi:WhiB family transcriptional regulator, redox-sensing transcriptional regulator
MQWRDATVGGRGTTGLQVSFPVAARPERDVGAVRAGPGAGQVRAGPGAGGRAGPGAGPGAGLPVGLDLPCGQDPELFFSESPREVELAKELCRGCRARIGCLAGALERREACGVWGGELLMRGAVVPVKRPRGRPRKTQVAA